MRKAIRRALTYTFWTVAYIYIGVTVLLHVPYCQRQTGNMVASALSEKIGARVSVGRIDLGFLNRIIIDDVLVYDQQKAKMLQASRLSAKIDIMPLLEGQVRVSSVQLFGLKANLYKQTAEAKPNFQFVVDSLSSKSKEPAKPLDVQIQSLILRNGQIAWNQWDIAPTSGRLNPAHLKVSDLSTHIALYTLTDDTLSAKVKRLSFKEQSGLDLRLLTFAVKASMKGAVVEDFLVQLPKSKLRLSEISATYALEDKKFDKNSLRYRLKTGKSYVTFDDLAFVEPGLHGFDERLSLFLDAEGSAKDLTIRQLSIASQNRSMCLAASGKVEGFGSTIAWAANIGQLKVSHDFFEKISRVLKYRKIAVPALLANLGDIDFQGKGRGKGKNFQAEGTFKSGLGDAVLKGTLSGDRYQASLKTQSFDLGRLLNNKDFGILACDLCSNGRLPSKKVLVFSAKGTISRFGYKDYAYQNIGIDGTFTHDIFVGCLSMNDPNGRFSIEGRIANALTYLSDKRSALNIDLKAKVQAINLHRLRLTDALGDRTLALTGVVDVTGSTLDNLNGIVDISNFSAVGEGKADRFDNLQLAVSCNSLLRNTTLHSDYGDAELTGQYTYETLVQSVTNIVAQKLPSLKPQGVSTSLQHSMYGIPSKGGSNFTFALSLRDASPLQRFLHLPLEASEPIVAEGQVDEWLGQLNVTLSAPSLSYNGTRVDNLLVDLNTLGDSLVANVQGARVSESGNPFSVAACLSALDDIVELKSQWNAHSSKPAYGTINARALLFREKGSLGTHVQFSPSIEVFDTVRLAVQPSDLTYAKNRLTINRFEVSNGDQHIIVNGQTTGHDEDSLMVDLQNLNVGYVLDLVNFHAVDFAGTATGTASIKSLFHQPRARANLEVANFTFNEGEMGTLHANVDYDGERINIDALADDGEDSKTKIDGYVSLKDNYIDLPIRAQGTRLQFLESFCGSFMDNVNGQGYGKVRVFGDLKDINIEGDVRASGSVDITPLRTSYEMRNCDVHIVPDHIYFMRDTIYDKYGNLGIVTGELTHQSLHNLSYDINVEAKSLLAYDHKTYGENTFFGTIFATGNCAIRGKSGELVMDVNAIPEKGSFIEYNASDESTLDETAFIHWSTRVVNRTESNTRENLQPSHTEKVDTLLDYVGKNSSTGPTYDTASAEEVRPSVDIPTDMHINFLVNTNQNFTLRILMDAASGDYIALNGDGVIRATYFNKGAFQMFGNYNVDHGVYKLTIQNVIRKEFQFQPGSTIAFGGDPYSAALNLKGVYTVNGASLSDLQLGNSFTRNNVRVNCIMDINGTPEQPTVDFDLDLPTLSSDAQNMVRSVINSEEDMNQQVLYLLAVGRFYPQSNNNASQDGTAQNQTSLAMQSLLSGTISQQINTVLSSFVKSNDWNFGANISTGDEGFSNAEYEGLLSGRMLNNRLLFNGQFGYRDNVSTNTSSFIGDFDLRYLLTPNGNVSVRVYNQTNDRYFTRNSLNTQGIGVILKKDFNSLGDIFRWRKKKNKK